MHIGGSGFHRVDQPGVLVHADVDFHAVGEAFRAAVEPLVAFLGLMHLGIPLSFLILSPPAHSGFALVEVELGAGTVFEGACRHFENAVRNPCLLVATGLHCQCGFSSLYRGVCALAQRPSGLQG